jgi:hypothetical protein
VTESAEFNQFMHLCQTLQGWLQLDFVELAEALQDLLDVDPDRRFAVLTKINGTVKDICNYFRERQIALLDSMVRCGELNSRTKRARLQSLTTGQLNCLVTAAGDTDLINTSQITLYVLFNCLGLPGVAEQSAVIVQDLAVPISAHFEWRSRAGHFGPDNVVMIAFTIS